MRKSLEALSIAVIVYLGWMTYAALAGPNHLPGRVPTHFDAAGHANGWGSPAMLLLLPIVAIALYAGMTLVSRFPAAFNYPVRVLPAVRTRVESITLDMIAFVKLELLVLFSVLQRAMIAAARGGEANLKPWLVPAFLVIIFVTVGLHGMAVLRVARAAVAALKLKGR